MHNVQCHINHKHLQGGASHTLQLMVKKVVLTGHVRTGLYTNVKEKLFQALFETGLLLGHSYAYSYVTMI